MAIKGYSVFPKISSIAATSPSDLVSYPGHLLEWKGVFSLCREAVGVFYNPNFNLGIITSLRTNSKFKPVVDLERDGLSGYSYLRLATWVAHPQWNHVIKQVFVLLQWIIHRLRRRVDPLSLCTSVFVNQTFFFVFLCRENVSHVPDLSLVAHAYLYWAFYSFPCKMLFKWWRKK